MRKLAYLATVSKSTPLEGSDRLSVTEIKGSAWKVVTSRGEFAEGDRAVYFEIDSALPPDDPRYAFLRERCLRRFVSKSGAILDEAIRIRTVRLRGALSQGLLLPVKGNFPGFEGLADGTDVTEPLGVRHYDEIAESLRPVTGSASVPCDAKLSDFPTSLFPKTDEQRIQTIPQCFTEMKGRLFEVTEKRDGQSVTMAYAPSIGDGDPFAVCTRNMRLRRVTESGAVPLPWKVASDIGAERKISDYCSARGVEYAFQGELQGPGINANRDRLADYRWQVFKVYDIGRGEYLLPGCAREACAEAGLPYVPVVEASLDVFSAFPECDSLLAYADGLTENGNRREGLVFKSCDRPYFSFKAVSNAYLLSQA